MHLPSSKNCFCFSNTTGCTTDALWDRLGQAVNTTQPFVHVFTDQGKIVDFLNDKNYPQLVYNPDDTDKRSPVRTDYLCGGVSLDGSDWSRDGQPHLGAVSSVEYAIRWNNSLPMGAQYFNTEALTESIPSSVNSAKYLISGFLGAQVAINEFVSCNRYSCSAGGENCKAAATGGGLVEGELHCLGSNHFNVTPTTTSTSTSTPTTTSTSTLADDDQPSRRTARTATTTSSRRACGGPRLGSRPPTPVRCSRTGSEARSRRGRTGASRGRSTPRRCCRSMRRRASRAAAGLSLSSTHTLTTRTAPVRRPRRPIWRLEQ